MSELHHAYLNLGSNIDAKDNLPRAVEMLKEAGRVDAVSTAWESLAVGKHGPNFLNACVLLITPLQPDKLKESLLSRVESALGRARGLDKFAPRSIDIDIVLFDKAPHKLENWEHAFVVVPLAELIPDFPHPTRGESLARVAAQLQGPTWILPRPDVLQPERR